MENREAIFGRETDVGGVEWRVRKPFDAV